MARKTVPFNKKGIERLPANKPAIYKIRTASGKTNYAGVAKRGRVQERLREHLPGGKDPVPGSKVQVEQTGSVREAQARERRVISRTKPPYNKKGK